MFETRLKVLLLVLMFALAIVVARLVDMQVLHAETYRKQAEDALLLPVKVIAPVRGRILDRTGVELVSDEPCWDVKVDYGVLALDAARRGTCPGLTLEEAYLTSRVERMRRQRTYGAGLSTQEIEARLVQDIERMWVELARFSGEPVAELQRRAGMICRRILGIRAAVSARRGFDTPVREERMRHAVLTGLDDQEQVAARELFSRYPWVSVEDSTRRVYHAGEEFAHVLGRLGPVTAADLQNDPFFTDPLRKYLGSEKLGVSGVERCAESLLRGRRGRFQQNREDVIVESTPPEAGGDVHLTIRLDLQRRLYEMFERRLAATPDSPGGSIVVLDVESRECLALVSYPGFDPDTFRTNYRELRRDTRRQPLRFRAAANHYAPGSIVKPLICLAGLNSGKIDLDTRYTCAGALFPDHPDRWRCWAAAGTGQRMRHGSLDVPEAIKHSCNIFMYRTGQLAGVQELTNYFDMVGFGRTTGTGLIEEVSGINPTPSWLASVAGRTITPGKARHFAIGQAEVSITPLQAANLMAVYASGEYRRVALVRELAESATWKLPGEAAHWRAIRRGLWGVVNDVDGTAHSTACLEPGTGYALCGKTGSAEARPWPVSYEIPFVDAQGVESIAVQHATTRSGAVEDFVREHPDGAFDHREIGVHQRWPPGPPAPPSTSHSHAWFAGYLQAVDETGRPVAERRPRIAFAVMVEFGGSGGRVSAPIGKQVARICIEMLGPELDPDTLPDTPPREERQ